MTRPVYIDVTLQPGAKQTVNARRPLILRRPMFLIESPLNERWSRVLISSITFEGEEQLAVKTGVAAAMFEDVQPGGFSSVVVMPPLPAGDEVGITFELALAAPSVAMFRVWFGELHELRKLRNPDPECPEQRPHDWRIEEGACTRSCRCVLCGAQWVSDPL